ncbi:MAG TPA: TIGR00282 family metallophosphoesterase [Patescibacteria group bacterium]|nr:TIGR00282 family metallophosphoesterase [Patescibacteria group bacterium]
MAKILFIGDVIGKPGRKALREVLPQWKEQYRPDAVVVNVENIAHGKGVTVNTLEDIDSLGIDCFTSGNHVFDKGEFSDEAFKKFDKLIRPANYPAALAGHGYYRFTRDGQSYLIINLNGRVFFERAFYGQLGNPFFMVDQLIEQQGQKGDIILVDLHAEATSEKVAFGWHCDGKVAAVVGTHTHVPTADAHVLPKGTAYITDVGMTGPVHSVIGVAVEKSMQLFLEQGKFVMEVAEDGPACVNGVLIETDGPKAVKIEKLYQEVQS